MKKFYEKPQMSQTSFEETNVLLVSSNPSQGDFFEIGGGNENENV